MLPHLLLALQGDATAERGQKEVRPGNVPGHTLRENLCWEYDFLPLKEMKGPPGE